ncbi:MAG: hypothetical protein BWY69_00650 [Planctomycetes bacterium ADurb.Bin401]|nr:MAG: hypothetical protein BWY69_00650 [Planctomycetes bacterium ADurb.Bin401]
MGLVWICESPVKVTFCPMGNREAEPAARRRVVPELPMSIVSEVVVNFPPLPMIFQQDLSVQSVFAPSIL